MRIGLVLGDRIVEERLLRTRETVTLGQSVSNHISVPIEGLPKSMPVFTLEKDRYALRFTGRMTGRVSSADGLRTLAQLKAQGASKEGDDWLVPLDRHSRGKVSLGPMTLLFQFVDAPPLSPAPSLPLALQRTLVSRVEPKLALILACSVFVHFAVALFAYTRDQILQQPVERIAHSFQVGQYELPEQNEPEIPAQVDPVESAAGASNADVEAPTVIQGPRELRPKNPDQRRETNSAEGGDEVSIEESVQGSAIVAVLSGNGTENGLFQQMNNTDQGASLDKSLEHAKGLATTTHGKNQQPRHRKHKDPTIGTGENVGVEGPGPAVKLVPKTEESVARFDPVEPLSISDLDPAALIKRIRSKYLPGIKRCHQRALKHDPRAQGKVAIRLTVGPTGRVTRAKAKGFSDEVDSCITGQASKWRFTAPTDEGERTSADFEVPLVLKPGG